MLAAAGAALAVPAVVIGLVGLEQAMAAGNDQLGLLPGDLARILGITAYRDVPGEAPWIAAGIGGALFAAGLLLARPGRQGAASA